ncbi:MAG: hypothetical protein PHN72_07035 [Bacilli bacterium]|nr:hypothetical protein [Bacilli bacterium]
MMGYEAEVLSVIVYVLLIILILVGIAVLLRTFFTLKKVDKLIETANERVDSLQNLFSIMDSATDTFAFLGDKIVGTLTHAISNLFKRKEDKKDE